MAGSQGIPGLGVACVGSGCLLVWCAVYDVPLLDALRSLARGQAPTKPAPKAATQVQFTGVQEASGFAPGAGVGGGANGPAKAGGTSGNGGGSW